MNPMTRFFWFLLRFIFQTSFVIILLLQNNSSAMLIFMSANCKIMISYKSICWLLIATILSIAFLPAHYHLHHLYNDDTFSSTTAGHAHVIDLHVLTEQTGQSHHDDEATIIAASPDGIVKKSNPDFFPFILLAMVLLLLASLNKQISIQLNYRSTKFKQSYPHFSPLLRAPPLH